MADELQESEMFSSEGYSTGNQTDYRSDSGESCSDINNKLKRNNYKAVNIRNSAPVNIPGGIPSLIRDFSDDFDYGDGEIVPPHVILRRRLAGKMAFSLCSGNGRTLKGRDLRQVRNSILRMTGFLEV